MFTLQESGVAMATYLYVQYPVVGNRRRIEDMGLGSDLDLAALTQLPKTLVD